MVFGTEPSVAKALAASRASTTVNTSFLERHNATDRHRNARKARRTYRFSKDWATHAGRRAFHVLTYNFCHTVHTLRQPAAAGAHDAIAGARTIDAALRAANARHGRGPDWPRLDTRRVARSAGERGSQLERGTTHN